MCVLADDSPDFGRFSTSFVACYSKQIQPSVYVFQREAGGGEVIGCHDETSVCVTPCCRSLSSKGCHFSSTQNETEGVKGRCRTTSAPLTISQTLPKHPNRSGVKTRVLLRVSWHNGWKPVEEFPVPSRQQKH